MYYFGQVVWGSNATEKVMKCRGIRGAITVEANTREAILGATHELLEQMVTLNQLQMADLVCAIFTTTSDLTAEFPAVAAREMGWTDSALLCGHEMSVPNGLPHCLRVLLLFNTEKEAEEIVHVYLKGAKNLRQSYKQDRKDQEDHK